MDIASVFKWSKERAEDVFHKRFIFWTSMADIALNFTKRRYYRIENVGVANPGHNFGALVAYLTELNLKTVSPKILQFIMREVNQRGKSMSRIEANFVPVWPTTQPQPNSPQAETFIGALFYATDGHWYLCLNQKNFGRWFLSSNFTRTKYEDLDPLNPKNAAHVNALNNKINPPASKTVDVDTVVTDLSDPADQGRYVNIDLKNFHGGGVFTPIESGAFKQTFEKYAQRQWYISKYKVPWKKPLPFTPLHEVKLLTPNLNLASVPPKQQTAAVKEQPKQIPASQPLLLIGNKSYAETVASLKISS